MDEVVQENIPLPPIGDLLKLVGDLNYEWDEKTEAVRPYTLETDGDSFRILFFDNLELSNEDDEGREYSETVEVFLRRRAMEFTQDIISYYLPNLDKTAVLTDMIRTFEQIS